MDGCKGPVAARVDDADLFLDVFDVFVEHDDAVDEILTKFLFVDRTVGPHSSGFYGLAGRADDAFCTGSDGYPDGVFDPAFAAEFAVFRRSTAFGTESLCEAHYTP